MAGLFDAKFIIDGTVTPAKLDISTASAPAHPASRQFVSDAITIAINQRGTKDPVRVATTAAITATGTQTIDGVVLVAGNRVLRKNETTGSLNGIWVVAAGAWSRSTDFDESAEIISGVLIQVQEGTTYAEKVFQLATDGTIVLGTTSLSFTNFSQSYYATPTLSNKNMQCNVTTTDGDAACATGLVAAPALNSYVSVFIGSQSLKMRIEYGNAVKTGVCYFSADGGTTPKAHNLLGAGDKLYWNGSVAGFQLAATDYVTFDETV